MPNVSWSFGMRLGIVFFGPGRKGERRFVHRCLLRCSQEMFLGHVWICKHSESLLVIFSDKQIQERIAKGVVPGIRV